MASIRLGYDREDFAADDYDVYDDEQVKLARLLNQLEAWLEAWQEVRCKPGQPMSERLVTESKRLARHIGTIL